MKTAIYRRPTSPEQGHVVDVTLGDGDIRTLSIHDAQHLYESLCMAIGDYLNFIDGTAEK